MSTVYRVDDQLQSTLEEIRFRHDLPNEAAALLHSIALNKVISVYSDADEITLKSPGKSEIKVLTSGKSVDETDPITKAVTRVVALDDELSQVGTVVSEREQAVVKGLYVDMAARFFLVMVVAGLFVWLNWEVMSFIKHVQASDPEGKIITTGLIMALIAATVTQVGIGIAAIVTYLFPKKISTNDSV